MKQNSCRIDAALSHGMRWIARTWGIASTLLIMFAFGSREHLRFNNTGEATAFLLFAVGVIAGFVIAWWRELTGGLVTVGCFLLFWLLAWSGRWPGIYFILFAKPGFLHIASALLASAGILGPRSSFSER